MSSCSASSKRAGATVAVDETCSGTQRLYHPTAVRDRSLKAMVRAAAERYLLPPTCPCFIEHTDRLNRVSELAREFRADGVIYHSLRICPLFDIEAMLMQQHLKEHGIPCLTLSTDYSREGTQQIRNRVEAFLEMLSGSLRVGKNRLPV
ncbi:MAG: 2-hydroxyacyl-CoA dehydratase [Armatimonadetes bacterium]|nr:2-hydroxyacyl-CoA dehydratase [Armatimonadota bacterium]